MQTTEQIRARLATLERDLKTLARQPGDLSPADRSQWDNGLVEVDQLRGQIAERTIRAQGLSGGSGVTADTGDGAAGAGRYRDVHVGRHVDQHDMLARAGDAGGSNTREGGALLRDAARSAIDGWAGRSDVTPEAQQTAENIVGGSDKYSAGVAEWVAVASEPVYERAFRTFIVGGPSALMGDEAQAMRRVQSYMAERAMSEGSVAAGLAAVPPMLDPLIVLSNSGEANSFRQLCTIKTITTQTWKGITSAGISCEWTAENAEFTDASPTFTAPSISPVKGDAYVQLSWELAEDSALVSDLGMLFADARDRLEATAFCSGTGATQPTGVTTALDLVTASRLSCTTASVVGLVDLYRMDGALPPRWRRNANWMANKSVLNEVRQAVTTAVANVSPWVDFAGDMPSKAIGYGVYEASGLSTTTSSNTDCLILGDWRGMYIVDRLPTVIGSTPWVLGANRRPIGATGVAMHFRVGSDVVVPSAFIMLRR